jgi:hypothetical protein
MLVMPRKIITEATTKLLLKCFAKKTALAVLSVADIRFFHKIALGIIYPSMQDDWYWSGMSELFQADEHATRLSPGPSYEISLRVFWKF